MTSRKWSFVFACAGHLYFHMFTAFYFVIVLTLEVDWSMKYYDLILLWTLGSLLVGLAALPAGRLGDVWSAPGMMIVFFIGMGAASVACGLVAGPSALLVGLAGIGLFGAIYHPIGIPWLIRGAGKRAGKVLAVNGVFGSLGTAMGALATGILIDHFGWRAAFILPGAVSMATGVVMLGLLQSGRIADEAPVEIEDEAGRPGMLRAFLLFLVAMFGGGIIYHGTATALPKLFAERLSDLVGDGATGIGILVAVVYTVGGVGQIIGGHLADRYPLKTVYVVHWLFEAFLLAGVALAAGAPLVAVAAMAVGVNLGQIPAQSLMLARCTPARHHGLAFGAQFVLMFCAAPLVIQIIAWVRAATGSFELLFLGFAAVAAVIVAIGVALPRRAVQGMAAAE